jgi:hypothetical protein
MKKFVGSETSSNEKLKVASGIISRKATPKGGRV